MTWLRIEMLPTWRILEDGDVWEWHGKQVVVPNLHLMKEGSESGHSYIVHIGDRRYMAAGHEVYLERVSCERRYKRYRVIVFADNAAFCSTFILKYPAEQAPAMVAVMFRGITIHSEGHAWYEIGTIYLAMRVRIGDTYYFPAVLEQHDIFDVRVSGKFPVLTSESIKYTRNFR